MYDKYSWRPLKGMKMTMLTGLFGGKIVVSRFFFKRVLNGFQEGLSQFFDGFVLVLAFLLPSQFP